MQVKIAAVQMEVEDETDINLQRILTCIEEVSGKADFACFPETCLVSDRKYVKEVKKDLLLIRKAAKQGDINVIFGTYVPGDDGRIKNQIIVISRQGKIVHRYSKKNPYMEEAEYVTRGKRSRVVDIDEVKFAVINCWDYAFPEHMRRLAKKGAKIIFCPSYLLSHPKTKNVLDRIPQVRAFDCMAYFVMVDAFTEETYRKTKICSPLKELASIEDRNGIIYAEVDLDEIDRLREMFPNF